MNNSVFVEIQFFMLIVCTFVIPIGIYSYMMWKRSISRKVVLMFGVLLIAVSGGNIFLLHLLRIMAKDTPSLLDDSIFASEMSVALYLIPAIFAGIGVNIISHILISHLAEAEKKFDREHKERR
ncbi:hypothetical protein DBR37_08935 [Herminiimonas sp. KBW02]|uniref:hypothetical protein n=1 Tax=Herminiimonas sp. KBW02 TaxID=2153363 RepID=UPI000F5AB552|nr:hypothetical protein [Herminiimonas sp. KBW02]RQO36424.1 hypothetical protein DBR37_08935 [Herminiimonas sp. KBW02]